MDSETTNKTVNEVLNKKNRIIKKLKKKNRKLNNLINYLLEECGCPYIKCIYPHEYKYTICRKCILQIYNKKGKEK